MAYNRWFTERILAHEPRIKSMLALPFSHPEACLRTIREFAGKPGVVGFLVTSQRHAGVFKRKYMPIYRELKSGVCRWVFTPDRITRWRPDINRFISVHSISFVTWNMIHLTNWIMNGLPEKFPNLKVIWIESGLAWLPFMMQRLDHEYLMRQSDAPLLSNRRAKTCGRCISLLNPWSVRYPKLLEATMEGIRPRRNCCTPPTGRTAFQCREKLPDSHFSARLRSADIPEKLPASYSSCELAGQRIDRAQGQELFRAAARGEEFTK